MAHSVSEEYLHRENIEEYFDALSQIIIETGIGKHNILVVGGAAMALKHEDLAAIRRFPKSDLSKRLHSPLQNI